jgi:hypothetical protein
MTPDILCRFSSEVGILTLSGHMPRSMSGLDLALSGAGWNQFADEVLDSAPDLISDRPYGVDSFAGWVFEYPILIALAGIERAGVAASPC